MASLLAGCAGCVPPRKPDQLVRLPAAATALPMPTLPPQPGPAAWRIPAGSLVRISPAGVAVEAGQLLLVPVPVP